MKETLEMALERLQSEREWLFDIAERLRNTPELGFFEAKTGDILAGELAAMGARVTRNLALTGIRAELGPPGAPAILLLADMDALPTLGAPGGVAHSCGHHAQMAVMAAVFKALVGADFPAREKVRLIFVGAPRRGIRRPWHQDDPARRGQDPLPLGQAGTHPPWRFR